MKRILVLGNLGYVGPVLVETWRTDAQVHITGFDAGYFEPCWSTMLRPARGVDVQFFGDVRDIDAALFDGVEAVVYLAAVSNDPMGQAFSAPTHSINDEAGVRTARIAKAAGVGSFVFASSCSVYGAGGGLAKTEADALDPLTDYARSKVNAEAQLRTLAEPGFLVTCLRFATACGPSPRLRLDLVLNDFVATALSKRRIVILSDGTPLRPLIDTRDMARALIWAAERTEGAGGPFLLANTGSDAWNFSVLELAQHVSAHYGGIDIDVNTSASPDKRSYQVDFSLFRSLAPEVYPSRDLGKTIKALDRDLRSAPASLEDFRSGPYIRLNVLRHMHEAGYLDGELRWTS